MDTAVQACNQLTRPPLPYRPMQYMHHLQVTYEEYTRHPNGTQEMNEAASHQGCDQETPSVTSVEVTDAYTDIPRDAWTDPEPPASDLIQCIKDVKTTDWLARSTMVTNGKSDQFPQQMAASSAESCPPLLY